MNRPDNHYVRLGLAYVRVAGRAEYRRAIRALPVMSAETHLSCMRACMGDRVWLAAISAGLTSDQADACARRYLDTLNS